MADVNRLVAHATKWSAITELTSKLVTPLTTMVLARILSPDVFGVLVVSTMVISFAEIFTDAGFQKYIVQHQFKSEEEKYKHVNVAFWTNLVLSIVIWIVIILLADVLAVLLGSEGYGMVISVSCVCIPLAAFSSIQISLFRKSLDFKTLFKARIIGIAIPIFITIPMAVIVRNHWALVTGMIALHVSNAVLLTRASKWHPSFIYDFATLKCMLPFSCWSMVDSVVVWLGGHVDLFVVGTILSHHYLGVYRTSMITVNQIMMVVTAITTPVMFSALSMLQNDEAAFKKMFLSFQKRVAVFVAPIGFILFVFSDFITKVLLGEQWQQGAYFLGLWGGTSAIAIVLSHYSSEIYRAKGLPYLSVISHMLHIAFVIPVVLWAIRYGFDFLCLSKSLARFQGVLVNIVIMSAIIKISAKSVMVNVAPAFLCSCSILPLSCLIESCEISLNFSLMLLALIVYIAFLCAFKEERNILFDLGKRLKQIYHGN